MEDDKDFAWYREETDRLKDRFSLVVGEGDKLVGDGKYVREQVLRYNSIWWGEWLGMMVSRDPDQKKFAMSEYNKLQQRCMPVGLGLDGKDLPVVNVINFSQVNGVVPDKMGEDI